MLKSFFFIPADNKKFLSKLTNLQSDFFIFDLEDAISNSRLEPALRNLSDLKAEEHFWIRIPNKIDSGQSIKHTLEILSASGYRNFIVPKFENLNQLEIFRTFAKQFSLILLIESAVGLLYISNNYNELPDNIIGMGLGSHDYCSDIGMVHSRKNLYYPQMLLHTICKAKHLLSIDIASMELDDMDAFKDEVKEAYDLGFDAKFIIHPKQLDVINELSYFTEKEMETIKNIYNQIKNRNIENIAPIRIGGHLYEKPHFKRILQIMEPREDGKK